MDTELLINAVQEHPVLLSTNDNDYKDKVKKSNAWVQGFKVFT